MSSSATALRLISDQPQPWDDRQWRWWLRDSGLLASLSPAEVKVLMLGYMLADAHGEFDFPLGWAARRCGYSERAVRDAAISLRHRGVFVHVGSSSLHQQIKRIALARPADRLPACMASTRSSPDALPDAPPDARKEPTPKTSADPSAPDAPPEPGRTNHGSWVPKPRKRGSPKEVFKESRKSSSSSAHTASSAGERSLFELPEYDAAAAAVLRRWIADPRQAHGLITAHRPTAANVRTIVANAFAWRHAYRTRRTDKPLHNVTGFIIAALRAGNWLPDDRLLDLRRRARARAKAAGRRPPGYHPGYPPRGPGSPPLAAATSADHARRQQAEALVAAMSPAELAERRERVIAGKEEALSKFDIEHPAMRRWLVDQVMQEIAQ